MNLKNTLKALKLNEPTISTVLGALVILAAAILVINYFRSRPQTQLNLPPAIQTEKEQTSVSLPTMHKVVKGESLWKIAEKYYQSGYNWTDISNANNLKNASLISEGQELTIPKVETKKVVEAPPSTAKSQAPPSSIQGSTYTVVKGDSLWKIAVRAYSDGYKWPQIWHANKTIRNPNKIFPGHELTLPNKS